MLSYLLKALSGGSGAPYDPDEAHRGGDALAMTSPRGVSDIIALRTIIEKKADEAAPAPSNDDRAAKQSLVCDDAKIQEGPIGAMREPFGGDGKHSGCSAALEVVADAPDGGKKEQIVAANVHKVHVADADKIMADTSLLGEKKQNGDKSIPVRGTKKRKRGGTGVGAGASSSTTTTPASTSIINQSPSTANHCVPKDCGGREGLSILPQTTAVLSTQLQIRAALMSTRSAIRRAYTHSNLDGVILISSGRTTSAFTCSSDAGIVGGNSKLRYDGNGTHGIVAIRYCGTKDGRTGMIEVEYARTTAIERAKRFLGCCAGAAINGSGGGGGGGGGAAPPRWEKLMLPPRVMGAYLGLLDNTCAYHGYSCLESGVKVHEGVLP